MPRFSISRILWLTDTKKVVPCFCHPLGKSYSIHICIKVLVSMTCSHQINTYTNSKYLYRGVSRFLQTYGCGKCSGCISKQRTDWRVRTYYECVDCLRSPSNFILFDTLTYCDDYIKKYSDLFPDLQIPAFLDKSCFSRDDVQKFFKRLRISLKRSGYNFEPKDFRYILSSEYGTSEETNGFKNTHRPHYHILFFVRFPIEPVVLSRFISRAWQLGKTDGVRPYDDCNECPLCKYCKGKCIYQIADYVENERVVRSDSRKNIMKCVNYVTKYVSKDMYLTGSLQENIDSLWRYLNPDFQDDVFLYRQYRRFCSQVLPFHLQSQGFGAALLDDDVEREYLMRTNLVHLPTGEKDVVRVVALPRYYQRKLYYSFEKIEGRVRWFLTDYGVETKVSQLDAKIRSFMIDYRAFNSRMPDSRVYDLALYKIVYKGTISDYQSLMLPYKQYYRKLIMPHEVTEQPLYYNRNTKRDKLTIGAFLSTSYVVTPDGEIEFKGKQLHKDFLPYDGYIVINDKVCPYWYGFDRKLVEFDRWRKIAADARDVYMYEKDVRADYYKRLGMLPAN